MEDNPGLRSIQTPIFSPLLCIKGPARFPISALFFNFSTENNCEFYSAWIQQCLQNRLVRYFFVLFCFVLVG